MKVKEKMGVMERQRKIEKEGDREKESSDCKKKERN